MSRLTAVLRRLASDTRGIAAEYALLLPVLLLLTAGAMEAGIMLMTDAALEMAVQAASRYGITNADPGGRDAKIQSIITGIVQRWVGSSGVLTIEALPYSSFADTNSNDSTVTFDPGTPGAIVLYRVTLTRPGFTGVLKLAGKSNLTFRRWLAVQNEPKS